MGDSNYLYWDSCIFLDGLRKTVGRKEHIERIESSAKGGEFFIYISTLVIAEVAKTKDHGIMTEEEVRTINEYFTHKFIRVIPVDRVIARRAAGIVRDYVVKPPDAIHIATAARSRCSVLLTYDEGLVSLNGQIDSLAIKRPSEFATGGLFGSA